MADRQTTRRRIIVDSGRSDKERRILNALVKRGYLGAGIRRDVSSTRIQSIYDRAREEVDSESAFKELYAGKPSDAIFKRNLNGDVELDRQEFDDAVAFFEAQRVHHDGLARNARTGQDRQKHEAEKAKYAEKKASLEALKARWRTQREKALVEEYRDSLDAIRQEAMTKKDAEQLEVFVDLLDATKARFNDEDIKTLDGSATSLRKVLQARIRDIKRNKKEKERVAKEKSEREATSKEREDLRLARNAESFEQLEERIEWARKNKGHPDAAKILENAPKTRQMLRKKRLVEDDIAKVNFNLQKLRNERKNATTPESEEYLTERIAELEDRRARLQAIDDFSTVKKTPGLKLLPRMRFRARETFGRTQEAARQVNKHTKKVAKSAVVDEATTEFVSTAKAAGFGALWRAQAHRQRRVEDSAVEAQRIARSKFWRWWYAFSRPVRLTMAWTLALAPIMVPVGAAAFAAWAIFALFAFIVNVAYAILVEMMNLVSFSALSAVNIAGLASKQVLDGLGKGVLSSLGGTYEPLEFDFAMRRFQASQLVDVEKYFPNVFNNNSILSTFLDFLGGVSPFFVATIVTAIAIAVPLYLMANRASAAARWATFTAIMMLAIPAVLVQFTGIGTFECATGDCSFYNWLADQFRTGTGFVFNEPLAAAQENFTGGET